jgi:hypothetical protein
MATEECSHARPEIGKAKIKGSRTQSLKNSRFLACRSFGGSGLSAAARHRFAGQLAKLERVGWGGTLLVIIEINIDVIAAPFPCAHPVGPILQSRQGVMSFVFSSRGMTPDVDEVRRSLPRRGSVVMVGYAQCDVALRE